MSDVDQAAAWHELHFDEFDHCYSSCWCCCIACEHTNPHYDRARQLLIPDQQQTGGNT